MRLFTCRRSWWASTSPRWYFLAPERIAAIDGVATGCEFTPYLPFVLVSAVLLRWWQAALIALFSVAILGLLFMGPPSALAASCCFLSSAGVFLAASAAMIGGVHLVRRLFVSLQRPGADETAGGVVFSLSDNQVWASWYGQGAPVLLGSEAKVSTMMQDFLAQVEVGKRLNGNAGQTAAKGSRVPSRPPA